MTTYKLVEGRGEMPRLFAVARRGDYVSTIAMRRRWFGGEGDDVESDQSVDDNDISSLPSWAQEQLRSYQSKLKEVNQESAGRRHQINELSERLEALEQQRQAGLSLEEKLKETESQITSLRQFEDRAKGLEALIRKSNEQRIAAIPEAMRSLVPVDAMSPEQVAAWLDKNAAVLSKPIAPELDGGAGGAGGGKTVQLSEQEKMIARRVGMTDEEYVNAKKRAGLG